MAAQPRREGLPRRARLQRRPDFLAVQERGRRLSGASYLLLVLPRPNTAPRGPARIGITVSKKVGKATVRNKVKRWVRESYRRMATLAPADTDLVVVARPSAAQRGFRATSDELRGLLQRVGR